jgi:hypothetical protein
VAWERLLATRVPLLEVLLMEVRTSGVQQSGLEVPNICLWTRALLVVPGLLYDCENTAGEGDD